LRVATVPTVCWTSVHALHPPRATFDSQVESTEGEERMTVVTTLDVDGLTAPEYRAVMDELVM